MSEPKRNGSVQNQSETTKLTFILAESGAAGGYPMAKVQATAKV